MRRIILTLALLSLAFAPAPLPKPGRRSSLQVRLDPVQLAAHGLKPADVLLALAPSGFANDTSHAERMVWRGAFLLEVFGTPAQPLPRPEQFGNVILRATSEGEVVRLKDVARVELRGR